MVTARTLSACLLAAVPLDSACSPATCLFTHIGVDSNCFLS